MTDLSIRLRQAMQPWHTAPAWRIAFSGGLDSSVLLHLLAAWARDEELPALSAIHVHHGLQPAAGAWPEHCVQVCARLGIPLDIVRVQVAPGASLEQAAERADAVLAELPPIDVLVLGMGEDGHTASLFPDSPNLEAALDPRGARRCLPMQAPSVPRQRLSMSLALLASARLTLLALHGPGKLATLNQALAGESYEAMPIRAFLARPLEIYWCP